MTHDTRGGIEPGAVLHLPVKVVQGPSVGGFYTLHLLIDGKTRLACKNPIHIEATVLEALSAPAPERTASRGGAR